MLRPISEWTLQKNEWLDLEETPEDRPPYVPEQYDENDKTKSDRLNSDETDEEFEWFDAVELTDDTYFTFVNKNRLTINPGD